MIRATKIVATLGPATDDPKVLDEIIKAGVDVVRINFSHGSPQEHQDRVSLVRNRARACGRQVGVIADLQGPKIRIERFKEGKILLVEGADFYLDTSLGTDDGDQNQVGVAYKSLPEDIKRGDKLLLDDGAIVLRVRSVEGTRIHCQVKVAGVLSNNKGINRQGGGLSVGALTEKDKRDIITAAELKADYLAVSFVSTVEDVLEARYLLRDAGGHGGILPKIERAEALENIDAIIEASDAIMIARGDLGVEIGDEELPGVQKALMAKAHKLDKVVITATQMMQSMVDSPIPTRAEVLDVANAVIDGTDAVMLSAETAVGKYPAKVIEAMDRICQGAERHTHGLRAPDSAPQVFERTDEAIAKASMYTAKALKVKAIAALTESGATTMWMSRSLSNIPIYAMSPNVAARRRVTLFRGVHPVSFDIEGTDHAQVNKDVIDDLKRRNAVRDGDLVIITKGDLIGSEGGTNAMKIVRVGQLADPTEGTLLDA